jgi:hypothetical protein
MKDFDCVNEIPRMSVMGTTGWLEPAGMSNRSDRTVGLVAPLARTASAHLGQDAWHTGSKDCLRTTWSRPVAAVAVARLGSTNLSCEESRTGAAPLLR